MSPSGCPKGDHRKAQLAGTSVNAPSRPRSAAPCAPGGLTLIELMIAIAIAIVLGAMALPSFGSMLQQRRLAAAAHALAGDLVEARQEAIRRGQPVQLRFGRRDGDWCYVLVTDAGAAAAADCGGTDPRLLKRVSSTDHPGIALLDAATMVLSPDGSTPALRMPAALLANARGEQLRVRLTPLGRAAICAPAAPVADSPRC